MATTTANPPRLGLSLMPQTGFWQAARPLLESDAVDVLEWSFDIGWGKTALPTWMPPLLNQFSQQQRLLGHGVSYSLLSAQLDRSHWLACLEAERQQYSYQHISEHFGWLATETFRQSVPLPMPLLPETLQLGRNRLQRLAEVAQVPVGLENLAFAFSQQDVREQGTFLEQLLEPVDGFLLLDVHNLYCQICNFQISAAELLALYPLHRVRELHISGGSWSEGSRGKIRRDTHDQPVPEAVFELLTLVLPQCPNVQFVIFERLGNTLLRASEQHQFRQDFARLQTIVQTHTRGENHAGI
ncbi:MAG: DUF692 family multinuclear iron-containing protein [Cyanobacteria bacterium P01_A01_bin.17]